jgi:alpha-galactosidase
MTITAEGLPDGLSIDPDTGNISGTVAQAGESTVKFTASNASGKDTAAVRIVIGSTICLTPPLGWNSWNCFHKTIDDGKIRGAADEMAATGLIDHGWTYINMDDRWEGERDAQGNVQSSEQFPDMKALSDYVHGKGLKIGIYSSPGPTTCGGAVGSYLHEDQDASTYAGWGMDYLKYDWCSYQPIAEMERAEKYGAILPPDQAQELETLAGEISVLQQRQYGHDPATLPQTEAIKKAEDESAAFTRDQIQDRLKEVRDQATALEAGAKKSEPDKVKAIETDICSAPFAKMRASLDKVNRDIVYSFSQYGGLYDIWQWGAQAGGNAWRTTGDITPDWKSVEGHGFGQNGHEPYAGPGHWNDPDMLEVGNGGLTPDETYTHMTLWCMLSAPLLIGCDMTQMSPFTVSVFSNDEVLAVDQDALGKQGWRAKQNGPAEVWMKPLEDGSLAVAFFNRGEVAANVAVQWSELKLTGAQTVRDLWRQKDLGIQASGYSLEVAPHGAELFKVAHGQ